MYLRTGMCNRCGRCCDLYCPHFGWIANTDIQNGTMTKTTGIDAPVMSFCDLHGTAEKGDPSIYGGSCATFPSDPFQTQPCCGFNWIEVENYDTDGVYYPPKGG